MKNERQRQGVDFARSDFALNYLQPLLPGGVSVDGVLQASGHAVFSARGLEDLRADIATGDGRWQLGGLPPIELKSAKLSIDDNGAAGTDIELKLPFASGVISGTANLAAGANFMDRSQIGRAHV